MCGFHEDRRVGLLNSFFIWRRILSSSGWHLFEREDTTCDKNINRINNLVIVVIALGGLCWLVGDWDERIGREFTGLYIGKIGFRYLILLWMMAIGLQVDMPL